MGYQKHQPTQWGSQYICLNGRKNDSDSTKANYTYSITNPTLYSNYWINVLIYPMCGTHGVKKWVWWRALMRFEGGVLVSLHSPNWIFDHDLIEYGCAVAYSRQPSSFLPEISCCFVNFLIISWLREHAWGIKARYFAFVFQRKVWELNFFHLTSPPPPQKKTESRFTVWKTCFPLSVCYKCKVARKWFLLLKPKPKKLVSPHS